MHSRAEAEDTEDCATWTDVTRARVLECRAACECEGKRLADQEHSTALPCRATPLSVCTYVYPLLLTVGTCLPLPS